LSFAITDWADVSGVNVNSVWLPPIDLPVVVLVEYDALVPGTVNDCKFKLSTSANLFCVAVAAVPPTSPVADAVVLTVIS